MRRFILLIFFHTTLFVQAIFPAGKGQLTGTVTDANSGHPLPHATVQIKGMGIGTAADKNGDFQISNITAGKQEVSVSRIGYLPGEFEIEIATGKTTDFEFALKAEAVKYREVLVTATRERSLDSDVSVAHQVIDRQEIERFASQNIGEVLENAQSLFVKNYGHIGALKTASIRGASENQVLILLDGQRINQSQGVAPDLSDLPLQAVQRIEVIRGGYSALYGTDAVGGVINLITRSTQTGVSTFGRVNSTVGSFGTRSIQSSFGQETKAFGFFAAHNYTESDGDFKFNSTEGETVKRTNNDLKWNDIFVKGRYNPGKEEVFTGYFQYHDADRGAPGPVSFASETARQDDRSLKLNLRFEQVVAPNLDYHAQVFYHSFKQNFDDPNEFFPIQSEHKNKVYGTSVQGNWLSSTYNTVTVGHEFRQDHISSTDISEQDRSIHSFFVQDQFQLPFITGNSMLKVIPAIRVDKYSDVETEISPKAGLLYRYVSGLDFSLRGNWGRSYRVPSFNDLYWPAGPFTAGNPDLIPEEGFGFDAGAGLNLQASGFWSFELNYFQTTLENLIIWIPDENGVFSPANIQDADIKGVETSFSYESPTDFFNVTGNYNYLDAVDNSTGNNAGNQLIYRPEHQASVKLNFNLSPVDVYGVYHYIGRRFTAQDNSTSLDGYPLVHLGTKVKFPFLTGRGSLRFELRNILDEEFQVIQGFPSPGREFRTEIGFEF